MSNDYFLFKQFCIHQRRAAMKVGTDAALLGTLAEGGRRILDIGAGTGIISLMMAQRNPDAAITAIEIDDNAFLDAGENIAASPFAERISLVKGDFCKYATTSNEQLYDCIVSNPPYFDESLENPDEGRTRARHTSSLSFRSLIGGAYKLLTDGGVFSVCLPPEVLKKFSAECLISGFYLKQCYAIKTVPRKAPRRYILVYQKSTPCLPEEHLYCMQNADGSRSEWYKDLMKDFYLD